jgi:phospholipid/cholesterol/gamma-HCH transport system permease protein
VNLLIALGAPWLLLFRAFKAARRSGVSVREVLAHVHEVGNRSVWLVTSGLAFFGVVMVAIAQQQAKRYTGNITVVGPAYFELLIREFGPMTCALLAAARAGAFNSAELASMTVNEQVEALRMSAGDPLSDLVAPRVLACVVAVPLLCVIGTIAASTSAVFTVFYIFDSNGFSFIDARYIDLGDIACGMSKAVLCGLWIPAAAARHGLAARGGSVAVGRAVTRGVVDASLGILVIDFVVALTFLTARI